MNKFDALFFSQYVNPNEELKEVFHRHFLVIVEDILLWTFFAVVIPAFLYSQDIFSIQSGISQFSFTMYLLLIYGILMYKFFDWYADVWVATDVTIVDVKWRYFTSNLLYIPYDKVEGIEVKTRSWFTAMIGMSDVVVKLAGQESFVLTSAANPNMIVEFLQNATQHQKWWHGDDDREPFEILVSALSDVVKWQLVTKGKDYITRDYVEKLDETLTRWVPIDLRSKEEKIIIENWKWTYAKKEEAEHNDGGGWTEEHGHH
jgi:hypothetical protein